VYFIVKGEFIGKIRKNALGGDFFFSSLLMMVWCVLCRVSCVWGGVACVGEIYSILFLGVLVV